MAIDHPIAIAPRRIKAARRSPFAIKTPANTTNMKAPYRCESVARPASIPVKSIPSRSDMPLVEFGCRPRVDRKQIEAASTKTAAVDDVGRFIDELKAPLRLPLKGGD